MSLDATRWAWSKNVTPSQKLVLLSLADRADETHECRPSIARLEHDTGLYRETIMEAISDLEKAGFLTVSRKPGCGNRYQLIGVDDRFNQSVKSDCYQSGKPDRYGKPDQSVKADCTSREKPTTTSREKPTVNLPIESTKNRKNKISVFDPLDALVSEGVDPAVAGDWILHRKAKKATVTRTVIAGIKSEAEKAGVTLEKALETSCQRGWTGFEAKWVIGQDQKAVVLPAQTQKMTAGQKTADSAMRFLESLGGQE